ncbi:MAG: methionine adenosyltransferase [Lachnospiraceae bacterium]|nr:methionine adenosyltransferase [Lachnospiraceae bacterium]
MLFTSEQVSWGHPDKICDQISDAIVTDCLKHDENSRVAAECMIKDYNIIIAGEVTSTHTPDYEELALGVLAKTGVAALYNYKVQVFISKQSPDIAIGVDRDGAGDQGMMFGYATNETPEKMPLPFMLATKALMFLKDIEEVRFENLLPDAKSQVTYDYDKRRIDTFLISTQHREYARNEDVHSLAYAAMKMAAEQYGQNTDFKVLVNPTGRFVVGGSFGDSGLTGRKIVADTYGGMCRVGGGAFSGKDPSKVDRSAAYMARKVAKDIIRCGLAEKCEIQLAYAIGVPEPVSISVDCFGTNQENIKNVIVPYIRDNYDLTPKGIISFLDLKHVDYNEVSSYGHFGRISMPWER